MLMNINGKPKRKSKKLLNCKLSIKLNYNLKRFIQKKWTASTKDSENGRRGSVNAKRSKYNRSLINYRKIVHKSPPQ